MERKYRTLWCVYSDLFLIVFYVLLVLGFCCSSFILKLLAFVCFVLFAAVKIVFGIRNIILAIELGIENDEEALFKLMKKTKYGAIWIFIVNYIVNFIAIVILSLALFKLVFLALPYIGLIVIMTYIDVVFTSSFGIIFVVMKKARGEMTSTAVIIHILLMLCFVIDVVDTIYLYRKFRKNKNIEV